MSETTNYADSWLAILGVAIGDEIMIVASGLGGSGFQGFLKHLIFASELGAEPLGVVLTEVKDGGTPVTVPWHSVVMISKAKTPRAPEPTQGVVDLVAELEAKAAE